MKELQLSEVLCLFSINPIENHINAIGYLKTLRYGNVN